MRIIRNLLAFAALLTLLGCATGPQSTVVREPALPVQEGPVAASRGGYITQDSPRLTPFGDYDAQVLEKVYRNWSLLLAKSEQQFPASQKAQVRFTLYPDGRVSEVSVSQLSLGGSSAPTLCGQAISNSAPFAPWPAEMRRMVGARAREFAFTFYLPRQEQQQ